MKSNPARQQVGEDVTDMDLSIFPPYHWLPEGIWYASKVVLIGPLTSSKTLPTLAVTRKNGIESISTIFF